MSKIILWLIEAVLAVSILLAAILLFCTLSDAIKYEFHQGDIYTSKIACN